MKYLFPALVVCAAIILLSQSIAKPFVGHHDWNGVQYGNMARNYLRYGLKTTRLGQIENGGIVTPSRFAYNTHYPPTLPLLLATNFKIFGLHEWAARLVPLLFSLVSVLVIYKIGEELIHSRVGVIAASFMIVTPMFRYFGKMPVHEPLILAFSLLIVYYYLRWRTTNRGWWQMWLAGIGAGLIGWPGFLIGPWLFLYDWWKLKRPDLRSFLPLFLTSLLIFCLVLLHNQILTGSPIGGGLVDIVRFRLDTHGFTPLQFLKQEVLWVQIFFTKTQILLAILGLWINRHRGLLITLIFFGTTYPLIFQNAAFIHDYLLFYLSPGIALAAAIALDRIVEGKSAILYLIAGIVFIAGSFLERSAFSNALHQTTMHNIGKLVGQEIKEITAPTDTIASPTGEFALIFSKFSTFYADRNFHYYEYTTTRQPADAQYLVVVKGKEPIDFNRKNFTEGNYIFWKKL